MIVHSRTLGGLLLIVLLTAACGRRDGAGRTRMAFGEVSRSWNPVSQKAVRGIPISEIRAGLQSSLSARPSDATMEQWSHVKRLYDAFRNAPLWLNEDGVITERVGALADALVSATTDAIQIDRYPLPELIENLDSAINSTHPAAAQLARTDLLLTRTYAGLSEDHLRGQIDARTVNQSWHIAPQDDEVDSALVRSLRDKSLAEAIARMRPPDEDYDELRRALGEYRRIVGAGGWTPIPAGKPLKRGATDSPARLEAIRMRLRTEGTQPDSTAPNVYDAALAAAIAQFQQRHAIGVDSMLGSETVDALNVSAAFRLAQIAANLERYRWLPRWLGSKYILVNVPAFRLEGYEDGKKTIEMKVIVGAEYEGRATPVFSDKMEYVVFRPYWNVTPEIAAKEFFPKYGTNLPEGFETYTEHGELRIRQRPGSKNSLGLVKFLFPNDFNIYLHDTPQENLFKKDVRAFSHGCIRVEKPAELAEWVLGWDARRVRDAMEHGPDNRTVRLRPKIPVYITYMTAYLRDGQLWFGNDLYHRDDALARAVAGGAVPTEAAVRAVEALRALTH